MTFMSQNVSRRIVVTGLGLVTNQGDNTLNVWKNIKTKKSFISKILPTDPYFSPEYLEKIKTKIGSVVRLDPEAKFKGSFLKKLDIFSIYGLWSAINAFEDAHFSDFNPERCGVNVSAGFGGLTTFHENILHFEKSSKTQPFFIPKILINMLPGHIATHFGLKGPNFSVVSACATGAHSISSAARIIACNEADIMIAGGSSSGCSPASISGFNACQALSTSFNDEPEKASRPFDKKRDGFVIGNGGACVVLEEYEHAKKRGAKIYAELAGYGETSDAYHMTAPVENGEGAARAMNLALKKANITTDQIGYINAHATSTPLGDKAEMTAIQTIFGPHSKVAISSTKSMTGHLLGAAGSLEAIFSILSLQEQLAPPTINLEEVDESFEGMNLIKDTSPLNTDYVLSNSFGFGGTNISLLFKRV